MSNTQKTSFLGSWGFLIAGIVIAAIAYFWAKPAHKAVEATTPAVVVATTAAATAPAVVAEVAKEAPKQAADAILLFASGKATLSAEAAALLAPVIAKMKANDKTRAVISGFNDATGDKDKNALLSKERAKSVREALRAAGVAGADDARIEMKKPDETMGGVDADAARRVEVTVIQG